MDDLGTDPGSDASRLPVHDAAVILSALGAGLPPRDAVTAMARELLDAGYSFCDPQHEIMRARLHWPLADDRMGGSTSFSAIGVFLSNWEPDTADSMAWWRLLRRPDRTEAGDLLDAALEALEREFPTDLAALALQHLERWERASGWAEEHESASSLLSLLLAKHRNASVVLRSVVVVATWQGGGRRLARLCRAVSAMLRQRGADVPWDRTTLAASRFPGVDGGFHPDGFASCVLEHCLDEMRLLLASKGEYQIGKASSARLELEDRAAALLEFVHDLATLNVLQWSAAQRFADECGSDRERTLSAWIASRRELESSGGMFPFAPLAEEEMVPLCLRRGVLEGLVGLLPMGLTVDLPLLGDASVCLLMQEPPPKASPSEELGEGFGDMLDAIQEAMGKLEVTLPFEHESREILSVLAPWGELLAVEVRLKPFGVSAPPLPASVPVPPSVEKALEHADLRATKTNSLVPWRIWVPPRPAGDELTTVTHRPNYADCRCSSCLCGFSYLPDASVWSLREPLIVELEPTVGKTGRSRSGSGSIAREASRGTDRSEIDRLCTLVATSMDASERCCAWMSSSPFLGDSVHRFFPSTLHILTSAASKTEEIVSRLLPGRTKTLQLFPPHLISAMVSTPGETLPFIRVSARDPFPKPLFFEDVVASSKPAKKSAKAKLRASRAPKKPASAPTPEPEVDPPIVTIAAVQTMDLAAVCSLMQDLYTRVDKFTASWSQVQPPAVERALCTLDATTFHSTEQTLLYRIGTLDIARLVNDLYLALKTAGACVDRAHAIAEATPPGAPPTSLPKLHPNVQGMVDELHAKYLDGIGDDAEKGISESMAASGWLVKDLLMFNLVGYLAVMMGRSTLAVIASSGHSTIGLAKPHLSLKFLAALFCTEALPSGRSVAELWWRVLDRCYVLMSLPYSLSVCPGSGILFSFLHATGLHGSLCIKPPGTRPKPTHPRSFLAQAASVWAIASLRHLDHSLPELQPLSDALLSAAKRHTRINPSWLVPERARTMYDPDVLLGFGLRVWCISHSGLLAILTASGHAPWDCISMHGLVHHALETCWEAISNERELPSGLPIASVASFAFPATYFPNRRRGVAWGDALIQRCHSLALLLWSELHISGIRFPSSEPIPAELSTASLVQDVVRVCSSWSSPVVVLPGLFTDLVYHDGLSLSLARAVTEHTLHALQTCSLPVSLLLDASTRSELLGWVIAAQLENKWFPWDNLVQMTSSLQGQLTDALASAHSTWTGMEAAPNGAAMASVLSAVAPSSKHNALRACAQVFGGSFVSSVPGESSRVDVDVALAGVQEGFANVLRSHELEPIEELRPVDIVFSRCVHRLCKVATRSGGRCIPLGRDGLALLTASIVLCGLATTCDDAAVDAVQSTARLLEAAQKGYSLSGRALEVFRQWVEGLVLCANCLRHSRN
jgi:hypothetical protein